MVGLVWLSGCGTNSTAAKPALAPGPTAGPAQVEAAIGELLDLMRERLVLMHEVARWKWNAARPIADEKRERELLADVERRGREYGLERQRARAFMAAQVEAGKLMQEVDFKRWQEEGRGEFSEVRDLATDLRPAIDDLSADLLELLAELTPRLERDDVQATLRERAAEVLQGDGIDDEVRATAIRPLAPQ